MWCIQEITPEYRERMYRLLDLYKAKPDSARPVICMDEKSKQLIEDIRKPIAASQGSCEKYDYEYRRNGTCNIFMAIAPKAGIRIVKVTQTRGKADFAYFIRNLLAVHFPKVRYIQLVLDNLNTHFENSIVETFGKKEAAGILKKVKFIYTPKHASWLNMAEIELNIMDRQCTGGRMSSKELVSSEVQKWAKGRNKKKCTIQWKFTRQDADRKLSKHYVS